MILKAFCSTLNSRIRERTGQKPFADWEEDNEDPEEVAKLDVILHALLSSRIWGGDDKVDKNNLKKEPSCGSETCSNLIRLKSRSHCPEWLE